MPRCAARSPAERHRCRDLPHMADVARRLHATRSASGRCLRISNGSHHRHGVPRWRWAKTHPCSGSSGSSRRNCMCNRSSRSSRSSSSILDGCPHHPMTFATAASSSAVRRREHQFEPRRGIFVPSRRPCAIIAASSPLPRRRHLHRHYRHHLRRRWCRDRVAETFSFPIGLPLGGGGGVCGRSLIAAATISAAASCSLQTAAHRAVPRAPRPLGYRRAPQAARTSAPRFDLRRPRAPAPLRSCSRHHSLQFRSRHPP